MDSDNMNMLVVDGKEALRLTSQRLDWPVVLGNDLIQNARYKINVGTGKSMTLLEQKVLFVVISRIQKDDDELFTQYFSVRDFCKLCAIPVNGGKTIQEIKSVINKLAERVMWLYDIKDGTLTTVRWISRAQIVPETGLIRIDLDPMMKPYLIGLNQYTKLYLHDMIRMKSKYGMLLYQLLMSYKNLHRPVAFYLQDFREIMDADKPSYQNIARLRTRIIEPAIKDINMYSSIDVAYDFVSDGNSAASKIRFLIRDLRDPSTGDPEEYARRVNLVEQEIADNGLPCGAPNVEWDNSKVFDFLVAARGGNTKTNNNTLNGSSNTVHRKKEVRASIPC